MPAWRKALPVAALCLAVNVAFLALIAHRNPQYLRDYRACPNPDAQHYVLLGRNFLLHGHYSRCSSPPYHTDFLRTPVYPCVAGGLDVLGGAGAIYLAQAILQALSCMLLHQLVQPYFGDRAAFWASLLLAVDATLAVANFEAMSEPLFTTLVLAATCCLLPCAVDVNVAPRPGRLVLGGLLLALATLARPAGLYLPVVFAVLFAVRAWRARAIANGLRAIFLLLASALLPVTAWIARNACLFSTPRLTHNDAIMLVHFAGAGAYQMEHGITLEEAQARICEEFGVVPMTVANNEWTANKPIAELDAELRRAAFPVLTKYPISLVKSSLHGTIKATFTHNVGVAAAAFHETWSPPSAKGLLRGDSEALARLCKNDPVLIGIFGWECLLNGLTWAFAIPGAWLALRQPRGRAIALGLLTLLAYFHLTLALVGAEAYSRSRTPHVPYVAAFAGLAAAALMNRIRPCSAEDEVPACVTCQVGKPAAA